MFKELPGSLPVRNSGNLEPLPPLSEATGRRKLEKDNSFPTCHFKREKNIADCRSSRRRLWRLPEASWGSQKGWGLTELTAVWSQAEIKGMRALGALLFSCPCSPVAQNWELLEHLSSAVAIKVQARRECFSDKVRAVFIRNTPSIFWRCSSDPWGKYKHFPHSQPVQLFLFNCSLFGNKFFLRHFTSKIWELQMKTHVT